MHIVFYYNPIKESLTYLKIEIHILNQKYVNKRTQKKQMSMQIDVESSSTNLNDAKKNI